MNLVCRRLGVAFFCLALSASCYAKAQQATVLKLNAYLDEAHQAGVFNGNVLVSDHGKLILRRAIGDADGSQTVSLSFSDRFDIGSIAKEFDAVGLLMLAKQGKLSLTDPLSKFFPDLPLWASTVTIDQLLHYTSGLPQLDWNTVDSDAACWKNLYALKKLDFPAGTHYAYNNNNTFLRRRVIEKVTGISFVEFVEKRELPKAGIRDAVIDATEATPRVAKSFDADHKQDRMIADISGWTSLTLDDMLRWSNCITDFCLISPHSTRQIVTTQNSDWQTGLGHGEMVGDRLVRHVHDGSDHNFQALLMAEPPQGRTLIIFTNQKRNRVYAMGDALNAILDGKPYVPLSEAKE